MQDDGKDASRCAAKPSGGLCAVLPIEKLNQKITLVTPVNKKENVKFYTEKCGFRIVSIEKDGNVELARFVTER